MVQEVRGEMGSHVVVEGGQRGRVPNGGFALEPEVRGGGRRHTWERLGNNASPEERTSAGQKDNGPGSCSTHHRCGTIR